MKDWRDFTTDEELLDVLDIEDRIEAHKEEARRLRARWRLIFNRARGRRACRS